VRLLVEGTERRLSGEMLVPCSKYHAHRALILASLAPGTSRITGLSDAKHVEYTIRMLRDLGTQISVDGDTVLVSGGRYQAARQSLTVGSSGSTLYFMVGLAALADRPVTITGQKYLHRRPVRPLLEALGQMGLTLDSAGGFLPVTVHPGLPRGGRVRIPGTLSQWISGLLLVAPFALGPVVIDVEGELNERSYVELTVRMMHSFGLEVGVSQDGRRFEIEPRQSPHPAAVELPPDIGSAAFGLAAAALHPSDLLLRGLPRLTAAETDHPEAQLLDLVQAMGLPMELDAASGAVRVRHDGVRLEGVRVDCRDMPDMLPVLATLGALARGKTTFEHIAHVRLKESDRVTAMLQLNRMGARLDQHGDRLVCHGVAGLQGAELSSFNDHRVLMALAVAATRARGQTLLTYPNAYRISYPRFLNTMNAVGLEMRVAPGPSPVHRSLAGALPDPERAASRPLTEVVRQWSRQRPDATALVEAGEEGGVRTWTWRQLDERADQAATQLLRLGVGGGDTVAYQLPNCAEFVFLTLGALRIGAICCPLMPIFRRREIAFALRETRSRVLVVPERFRGRDYPAEVADLLADAAGYELPLEDVIIVSAGDGGTPRPPGRVRWHEFVSGEIDGPALAAAQPQATDLAQLLYTSGTSGAPKGVLHRFDALSRAAAMAARHLSLNSDDRVFIPSPLAHQTGFLYGMWLALLLGSPQILQAVWDSARALELLREHGGTFVQAATPFLSDLVKAVEEGEVAPPSLRIFVATGAAVPRGLAERATRVLGAAVCGAWGTTETCLGSLSAPGDEPAKVWGTDGRALAGVQIRVTDDVGGVLAAGHEGNFEVRSKCLFEGYLDHPEWTQEVMTWDGWYRSGDLAVIDERGYVRIRGRVKDVVNRGGEKVPVAEIEQLLYLHPDVDEVAIVAMPDPRLGERACAFVVPRPDANFDFASLQRYLDGAHVAKHYWPEHLELVASLPRNPSGKIQKFMLRERARGLPPLDDQRGEGR